MLHHLGLGLQLLSLVALPLLILWQLNFGFQLLYMPIGLLIGMGVFALGTQLRERG